MKYTITLTTAEDAILQEALPARFTINGVTPTAQEVLTKIVKNEIKRLEMESERMRIAERIKSNWAIFKDEEKEAIKKIVIKPEV